MSSPIDDLLKIMDELREKCPWDQKQTIQTLRQQTIEETYELTEAITAKDWTSIKEELGDLLLHIVFYSKIATEKGAFHFNDVVDTICQKLIRRHPHIYGNVEARDAATVKRNWEMLKLKEGKQSVLGGVPSGLPALMKAMRIQDKAKQVGFEWETAEDVWKKVEEEKQELTAAVQSHDLNHIEKECGDLLFSVVNYVRFLQVDAENALELTNRKFIRRFQQLEAEVARQGKDFTDTSLAEMDDIWNRIKTKET